MPAKPEVSGADQVPALVGAGYGGWGALYPNLASWLCDATWQDGSPMGKTRLSVSRDATEVRVVLQTADFGGLRVECSSPSPDVALKLLESLLKSPKVPWQVDPYPIGQVAKKGKK